MNAYEMVEELDSHLDNVSVEHWSITEKLMKLNRAHRRAANKILLSDRRWLMKKSSLLTPVSGTITLPLDCVKPVHLTTSDGEPLAFSSGIDSVDLAQNTFEAFVEGSLLENTIAFSSTGLSSSCYLWYVRRVPDLICGTADTGSSGTNLIVPLDMRPRRTDDYYNDQYVEIVEGDGAGASYLVSDYIASSRSLTLTGASVGSTSVFGSVSSLPEEALDYVILHAAVTSLAKPGSTGSPESMAFLAALLKEATKDFEEFFSTRHSGAQYVDVTGV